MKRIILFFLFFIISFSFLMAQDGSSAMQDTIELEEIFDPKSDLDPLERAEDLDSEINESMDTIRRPIFEVITPILMVLIVFFMLFLMFFMPIMFIKNILYHLRIERNERFKQKIDSIFREYLFSEKEQEIPLINEINSLKRRILFVEYSSLMMRNKDRVIRDRMLMAYRHNMSIASAKGIGRGQTKRQKTRIIRQTCIIPARKGVAEVVMKHFFSEDRDLRLWSRVFYLGSYPEKYEDLFKDYPFEITHWERVVYADWILRQYNALEIVNDLIKRGNYYVREMAIEIGQMVFGLKDANEE